MRLLLTFLFLLHFVCQAQNEQLIPYRIKNKWGYSNTNGKILIPVKYSYANIFQDSLALVKGGGKFYFINLQGDNIFRKKFSNATPFSNEGIAKVIYQKKIFFINKKVGWAAGYYDDAGLGKVPVIVNTTDGGETWSERYRNEDISGYGEPLIDIRFKNELEGYALSRHNYDVFTTDGGQT